MIAGCARGAGEETSRATPAPAGVALEGATLVETAEGQKVWEVTAHHIDYRTEAGLAELADVKARFYQDGKLVSEGQAPRAVFVMKDRELTLEGGIRVEAAPPDRGFTAERVRWVPGPGRLEASGAVTFWRGPNRLMAGALVADRPLSRVTLSGGVHGQAFLTQAGTPSWAVPSTPARGTP